jgi:hypothetical protein
MEFTDMGTQHSHLEDIEELRKAVTFLSNRIDQLNVMTLSEIKAYLVGILRDNGFIGKVHFVETYLFTLTMFWNDEIYEVVEIS